MLKITCRLRLALDYQRFRTDEVQTIQHEYKDVCGLLFKHVFQHDTNGIIIQHQFIFQADRHLIITVQCIIAYALQFI